MKKIKIIAAALIAGGLVLPMAHATNGYFSHGYGMKSKGMGGVGIALPQDTLAAASNPAGMVEVGNRVDFGLDWFSPKRDATIAGTNYKSGSNNFYIPEFGYNQMRGTDTSIGVAVYGNGGMNTDYPNIPQFNSSGLRVGVNLEQLFIAPTWAKKITPTSSIGISLNLAYQKFSAKGIYNFNTVSSAPSYLSDNGDDSSTGLGVRLGWTGQVSPDVTVGATYQSRTYMSKFDKYRGLFADAGSFDIPENYGVGIAFKANPATTFAADIVRISYSGVPAIANTVAAMGTAGHLLGQPAGIGFGWKDQTVFKFGLSHQYSKDLTVRAGYNQGSSTIPNTEMAFNVLAPATVEKHATLGATWTLANQAELTLAYMHAFSNSQTGETTNQLGVTPTTIRMHQDSLGIAYGWKF